MRLTPFAIFSQLTQSLDRTLAQYTAANARLSSGKKINAPSDDVNGMIRSLDYRVSITENEQFKRNVEFASSTLKVTDTTLTSAYSTLSELKRFATLSLSGSADAASRAALSNTAAQMRDNLYNLANAKHLDQYLFAGFTSNQQPYVIVPPVVGAAVNTFDSDPLAGASVTGASITAPAALTGDEYRIGFDAAGLNYTVYNNATGDVVTAAAPYTSGPPGTSINLPGMNVVIAGVPSSAAESIIIRPPLSTYAYQGDSGALNVQIDQGATLPVNVTGNTAFSYALSAPLSQQLSGGTIADYTPSAVPGSTTIDVQIFAADHVTVLDRFSYSNMMDMANILSSALSTNNTLRINALRDPLARMQTQLGVVQAEVGSRQVRLNYQSTMLTKGTDSLKDALGVLEDDDSFETVAQLKKTEITLQSLRESASKILSQSLLDFLR